MNMTSIHNKGLAGYDTMVLRIMFSSLRQRKTKQAKVKIIKRKKEKKKYALRYELN